MSKLIETTKLPNGTLIRHKFTGYEGRIDGITEIKACFTRAGAIAAAAVAKDSFQYRVEVAGEPLRRIAPAEDFEILEGVVDVVCVSCASMFRSKPGVSNKAGGHCSCGGWICPTCLSCQTAKDSTCTKQSARKARKLAAQKKAQRG